MSERPALVVRAVVGEEDTELRKVGKPGGYHFSTQVSCACSEVVGGRIYVTGRLLKFEQNGKTMSVVAVLDIAKHRWRWVPLEGPGSAGSRMFLYEDSIFLFGLVNWRNVRSNSLSRLDLQLEEWSTYPCAGKHPSPRSFFSGHFIEERGQFLLFGGKRLRLFLNDLALLDMSQRSWIKPRMKGRPPSPRYDQGSCVHKGVFYLYGGVTARGMAARELFILEFASRNKVTWSCPKTNAATTVGTLCAFTMSSFGNVLLLCGGVRGYGANKIAQYDPDTERFSTFDVKGAKQIGSSHWASSVNHGRTLVLGSRGPIRKYLIICEAPN